MDLGDFLNSFGTASSSKNQQSQKDNIESIITEFIENEKDDKGVNVKCITKLLIAFQMKQTHLLDFFTKLKFYFLNGREITRQRSAHLVYLVFQRYSGLNLFLDEINCLFEFFLAKLHDFATALYSHKIIHQILLRVIKNEANLAIELKNTSEPILSLEQWKQGIISQFIQQIGDPKLSPSSYSQEVRDAIFTNVIFLQEHFKHECCHLGQESVKIFIDITEDEKDPRCIVKVFKIIKLLLDSFSEKIIEPFSEEIFTNLECYYPIDFHPDPEQDKKYQISTKDLSDALDECLISPHLKSSTFKLLQEKMSSSFVDAKLAGLQTYSKILKNYLPNQLTTAERKGMLDDILENAQDIEETDLTEAVVSCIKDFIVFLIKSTKHTETINEEYYCDIKRVEKHAFKLLEDGLLHLNALLAEKILTSLVPISDSLEALITNSIVKYFNSKFSAKDSTTASKQLELLLIVLLAAEKQIEAASSHIEKRRYFIDETKQNHLKGILMGEIQSADREEQNKILAVAILSKLAIHGQTPGEQDIAFMGVSEDIGLSEMDIEGYSSTLKKCLVEYCFLIDSRLEQSQTELLRLRLIGLLGQNNMAEHVTSAFGAMVLSGNESWKECVQYAAQNIFKQEARQTVESLIQKMLTLQTKHPKISVYFVEMFLQQEIAQNNIEKSKFMSYVKSVIGGAVSLKNVITNCSDSCSCCIDDMNDQEQSKKILATTDLTKLVMFTKYLKRMPVKTGLSSIFKQYLVDLLSFNLHPFMTSMALFFGNKAHLYLTSEQFQQVIVFLTQQLTQQQSIHSLPAQHLKILSKILRGLLLTMNEQSFKLLKDIISLELSEQHTLPLSFYTDVLGSDNYSEDHKSYLIVTPTQPQRIFLTFLHPFHNKILNLPINHQLKNRCYHVLISVLLSSPFALVTSQKEICLPILVQALTFASDTSAVESAINLLSKLINLDLEIIGSRAESLLSCLLKLLTTSQLSVSCLNQLLKCLAECTRFQLPLVKRFKNEVLDSLENCLSHKKRIVRRHAVFAVNRWHQII